METLKKSSWRLGTRATMHTMLFQVTGDQLLGVAARKEIEKNT
jgi:hypothetical protein